MRFLRSCKLFSLGFVFLTALYLLPPVCSWRSGCGGDEGNVWHSHPVGQWCCHERHSETPPGVQLLRPAARPLHPGRYTESVLFFDPSVDWDDFFSLTAIRVPSGPSLPDSGPGKKWQLHLHNFASKLYLRHQSLLC